MNNIITNSNDNIKTFLSAPMLPDTNQYTTREFLSAFFDDGEDIGLRAFKPKGSPCDTKPEAHWITTLADLHKDEPKIEQWNKTKGVYFVVNCGGDTDTKIKRYNAFFVENDALSIPAQHAALDAAPLPPSIRIETRKSVHAYWLSKGDDLAAWVDMQKRLIAFFDGDAANKNASRVMRLPNFDHLLYDKATGDTSRKKVEIVDFDPSLTYTLEQMRGCFPAVMREPEQHVSAPAKSYPAWKELNAELGRLIMSHETVTPDKKGVYHCKGICHNGYSDTAVMYDPNTGASKCLAGCGHDQLLRAFGLPELPEASSLPCESWPELNPKALYGLARDFVRMVEPHSEADPAALLAQFLIIFGNVIGRGAHFTVEADRHYLNLFGVMVGKTAGGRKGTSWGQAKSPFTHIDEGWAKDSMVGGLSSGEGLIWAVRDQIEQTKPIREKGLATGAYETTIVDKGVADKRAMVFEGEFASVLRVQGRDGNTLSAIVRHAWDTGNLRSLTKNSPARATGAHISMVGHITKDELNRCLAQTETFNGYANRFLWLCVKRSKILPEGGEPSYLERVALEDRLKETLTFAKTVGEMKRDEDAKTLWYKVYPKLSEESGGFVGAVTARATAQVVRLSCIYALLDLSSVVRREHLEAALAFWQYCEDSARYVFAGRTGDPTREKIVRALRGETKGLTRTEVNNLFGRNIKATQLNAALNELEASGLAVRRSESAEGSKRPAERWLAAQAGQAI